MTRKTKELKLERGSKVAVIGGGPAGSFFAFFFIQLCRRLGREIQVDIYEPKDFTSCGPKGCNHCGGIVSESLIQSLAAEGISIPAHVSRNAIETYTMHMDNGSVRISSPSDERRIISMYRGAGPRGSSIPGFVSFDGYLLSLVSGMGARIVRQRVLKMTLDDQKFPVVHTASREAIPYDLVVVAAGMTSRLLKSIVEFNFGYRPPETTKAHILEYFLSEPVVRKCFGDVMHVFLLKLPRLRFAAIIPKGEYVSVVLLGESIDKSLVQKFLDHPRVKSLFPPDMNLIEQPSCMCSPMLNIGSAKTPFADRIVLIGDSATTKLYKNGIGAAFKTSRAAASTALMHGISAQEFKRYYMPTCRRLEWDNRIGKWIFSMIGLIQGYDMVKKWLVLGVRGESLGYWKKRILSKVLWDMFTGSASYKSVLLRMLHPGFYKPMVYMIFRQIWGKRKSIDKAYNLKDSLPQLGKLYNDREVIIRQGDEGDTMHVILSGKVHVFSEVNNREYFLAELGESEFFGEMAIFRKMKRSTTVRAAGPAVILTVDKHTLMQNIQDNPSLAFRILEKMSDRLSKTNEYISRFNKTSPDHGIDGIEQEIPKGFPDSQSS